MELHQVVHTLEHQIPPNYHKPNHFDRYIFLEKRDIRRKETVIHVCTICEVYMVIVIITIQDLDV